MAGSLLDMVLTPYCRYRNTVDWVANLHCYVSTTYLASPTFDEAHRDKDSRQQTKSSLTKKIGDWGRPDNEAIFNPVSWSQSRASLDLKGRGRLLCKMQQPWNEEVKTMWCLISGQRNLPAPVWWMERRLNALILTNMTVKGILVLEVKDSMQEKTSAYQ